MKNTWIKMFKNKMKNNGINFTGVEREQALLSIYKAQYTKKKKKKKGK